MKSTPEAKSEAKHTPEQIEYTKRWLNYLNSLDSISLCLPQSQDRQILKGSLLTIHRLIVKASHSVCAETAITKAEGR